MNRYRLPLLTALSITVLAVAFTALSCGGDADDGTNNSPTATSRPGPADTPMDEPTSTVKSSPTEGDSDLQHLVQGWLDGVNGKVVYDYLSNFGLHPDGTYTTYYLDGNDRHEWFSESSDFGVTVITMNVGDKFYVCIMSESNPTCRETSAREASDTRAVFLIILQTSQLVANGVEDATLEGLPDREIAGLEARCFQLNTTGRITEGPPGTEQLTYCFSNEGHLLSFDHGVFFENDSLQTGDLSLEAVEVAEATPADFEPPAQVINPSD